MMAGLASRRAETESRDGGAKHRIGDFRSAEASELLVASYFFDAEVERLEFLWVDQDRGNSGASEHRGRGRAGKATADDRDVGASTGWCWFETPVLRPERQLMAWSGGRL